MRLTILQKCSICSGPHDDLSVPCVQGLYRGYTVVTTGFSETMLAYHATSPWGSRISSTSQAALNLVIDRWIDVASVMASL